MLVTAAEGGIGNLLVQEAKAIGATVIGVAGGAAKVRAVSDLGADVAVDYDASRLDGRGARVVDRPVTVVFDGVGGQLGSGAVDLLGSGGRLVMYGWVVRRRPRSRAACSSNEA